MERVLKTQTRQKVWKIFPPILLVFGLVGNGLTVAVIRRLGLRNQPTLVFISVLAVNDSVVLLTGLPRYWINYVFDFDLRTISDPGCKLSLFSIYLTMQYSSWILVGVSIERMVKTYFPFKYRRVFTTTKVIIGLVITFIVLAFVNGHFFFTNGINDFTNGSCDSLNKANEDFDEYTFTYIDFTVLSLAPFTIMLVCNIFLVRVLHKIQQERASMMHDSVLKRTHRVSVKMTRMLVVCTFYFILATAPISLYFILDTYLTPVYEETDNVLAIAKMDLAWSITYLLQFSNYCVNFYLYTATNTRFAPEMKALLKCKPRYGCYIFKGLLLLLFKNVRLFIFMQTRGICIL